MSFVSRCAYVRYDSYDEINSVVFGQKIGKTMTKKIAVLGGTGKLGLGLAYRWAKAGHKIVVGSRDPKNARYAAEQLSKRVPEAAIVGMDNAAAAKYADIVVLTVPFSSQLIVLRDVRDNLHGKILVDTTVPLVPPRVSRVQLPAEGSAAMCAYSAVGEIATVVSAFHNVAATLVDSDASIDGDVLVFGDVKAARGEIIHLAADAGMRAWHAGPLANSAAAEAMTSVLIHMNRQYGSDHAGIRIVGVKTT